jgi:hypothetical protein
VSCPITVKFASDRVGLTQKEVNRKEVPGEIERLNGTAFHHQWEISLETKIFVLLEWETKQRTKINDKPNPEPL